MITAKALCKKILSYLNCEFIFTGIAVLKIVTMLLAIVGTSLMWVTHQKATWFKKINKTGKSDATKCVEIYLRSSPAVREAIRPCPMEWMILAPKYCVVTCLGISGFFFFIILFFDLTKYKIWRMIDKFYHMLAGFLLVLFSLFVVAYLLLVFIRVTCADDGVTNVKQCKEQIWKVKFQVWMFIPSGVFVLYTGIAYCIAGPMIMRQERIIKKVSSTDLHPSKNLSAEMGDMKTVIIAVEEENKEEP